MLISNVSQDSILSTILYTIFISDLGDGAEYILSKFVGNTELGQVADILEGYAGSQNCMQKKWVDKKLMKLNKGKYKVLYLGRKSPFSQCMLATDRLQRSFSEKALGVLDGYETSMCLHKETNNSILGCIKSAVIPLYSALIRFPHEYCVHFWASYFTKDTMLLG